MSVSADFAFSSLVSLVLTSFGRHQLFFSKAVTTDLENPESRKHGQLLGGKAEISIEPGFLDHEGVFILS